MNPQRAVDLCTCGKPRVDEVHGLKVSYGVRKAPPENLHPFHPNPQPVTATVRRFVPSPELSDIKLTRVHAFFSSGAWVAQVDGEKNKGYGQAAEWLEALNAAIEDLKEK